MDYVSVANLALSKLGEDDQIRDPDDTGKPASSIRAVWDLMRRVVLRAHPWNFAMRRAELVPRTGASLVSDPVIGWEYAFPLPSDFLRLVELLEPRLAKDTYQVEGHEILANTLGPLRIRYVRDVPDMSRWDALAIEAFASRLAFQIADRITGDEARKRTAWSNYKDALKDAKGVDAKENPPVEGVESAWVEARLS